MFTEADIAQYDSSGVVFTLRDSSVTRIATTWSVEIAAPRRRLARPKIFAVLVGGDTTLVGKVQYLESSHLPEGPLMNWPPISNRLRIYAARAPGIRTADAERIREALRLAGVPSNQ